MLAAALSYAERGWSVLPLHSVDANGRCSCQSPCRTPGKHPRISQGLLNASSDPAVIERWWLDWPDANIGVRTGTVSDLWVLDIDNSKSLVSSDGVIFAEGENTLRTLEQRAGVSVPDTLTNMTGSGGRHLLFSYPADGDLYRNRVKVAPSIDIRGENGYIVVPPSMHASGKQYEWADESEPIAEPPEWLLNLQGEESNPFQNEEVVGEGGRNDYLFRFASKLVGEGRDHDEVANLVVGTNRRVCDPPLTDSEVMLIINSALKYDSNPEEAVLVFDDEPNDIPLIKDGESIALSISEIFRNPPQPKEPLISDGILDVGDGLIMAGASNVGKSWLAMDMAVALTTGGAWLDRFECRKSRVLYIDEESSMSSDYQRFKMIFNGHMIPEEVVKEGDMPLYLAVQRGAKMDTPKGYIILSRMLAQYKPDVVIFDALVRMHSGDENSTRDMSSFFDVADQLQRAYACAFVFLHHIRKPSKDEQGDDADQMRGNSDIKNWPDTVLMVRENDPKDGILVSHAKSRDHAKLDRFEVGRVIDGDEASFKFRDGYMDKPTTIEDKRAAIIKIIKTRPGVRVTVPYLAMELAMSMETVINHVKPLLDTSLLAEVRVRGEVPYLVMASNMKQRGYGDEPGPGIY